MIRIRRARQIITNARASFAETEEATDSDIQFIILQFVDNEVKFDDFPRRGWFPPGPQWAYFPDKYVAWNPYATSAAVDQYDNFRYSPGCSWSDWQIISKMGLSAPVI